MAPEVAVDKIQKVARSFLPLTIKTHNINHDMEEYLEQVLSVFLEEFGQKDILAQISYCMRELSVNANKANTKRVYFMEKGLDIDNPEQYEIGMSSFKTDTLENIPYYIKKQKENELYIKIIFHATNGKLTIYIKNNSKISRSEQMRIYDKIARARAFNTLEEAMSSVLDNSEGAGLGLVILVLMLKKLGLNEEAFEVDVEGDETVTKLIIPFSEIHKDNLYQLSSDIVKEFNEMPKFPENILYLQKMLDNPESKITDISRNIAMDISLAADLLKIANSAQYMFSKKVNNITDAVKIVGIRGLKNLLLSYGTHKVFKKGLKEHWDHANKTAFYGYVLAKKYVSKKDILDDVYIGGILHDIGKIILFSVNPKTLERISDFCKQRKIDRNILENLSAGLNHAEIGALIAEKWNFPDNLINMIKYHHEPGQAPLSIREAVETIYMANSIANYEEGAIVFDQISKNILKKFGIKTEEQFTIISTKLAKAFEKSTNNKDNDS